MQTLIRPLQGIRVLEFGGLAPAPFCGLLLADYGADVVRIDRPNDQAITNDVLCRNKRSIQMNLKNPADVETLKKLARKADVVLEPFRPGVMEKLGLGPDVLLKENPKIVYARLTGFRRDGKYKDMAGHDINYLSVSGILSMIGTKEKPVFPGNILGDFAGGGAACFQGILLALFARERTGRGQVVEANMADAVAYLGLMPRIMAKTPSWNGPRGTNMLDGGCPFYNTYQTKDGKFVAVGALEPQFFKALMKGMELPCEDNFVKVTRHDKQRWPAMEAEYATIFKTKTRTEWERIFDGTDACVTPVLTPKELESSGHENRSFVHLSDTPSVGLGAADITILKAGQHQNEVLSEWLGHPVPSRL